MPVTFKTFDNPIDAHLLKGRLESEGIWCALHDENTMAANPLYNLTIGGIKLVIHEEDVDRATAVLEQSAHHRPDQRTTLRQCPHCNSTRVESVSSRFSSVPLIQFFIQGIKSLFFKNPVEKSKCKDCHRNF